MQNQYTIKAFEKAVAKFQDYGNRLRNSDYNNAKSALRLFVQFCETDSIISAITKQLKESPKLKFDEWLGSLQTPSGWWQFDLPTDEEERLAILYSVLFALANDINQFEGFVFQLTSESQMTSAVYKFNQMVTDEFLRDFGYKLEALEETIQKQSKDGTFTAQSLIVFASEGAQVAVGGGVISNAPVAGNIQSASGSNISQLVQTGVSDVDKLLGEMLDLIKREESISDEEREQLQLDVAQLSQELKLKKPRSASVFEKLKNLATCAALISHASAILAKLIEHYGWAIPPMLTHLHPH